MEELTELGRLLRTTREAKGITPEKIYKEIRIKAAYVNALETLNVQAFPSEMYFRAFLKNYSSFLGLSTDVVIKMYEDIKNNTGDTAADENIADMQPVTEPAPKEQKQQKSIPVINKNEEKNIAAGSREKTYKNKESSEQHKLKRQKKIKKLRRIKRITGSPLLKILLALAVFALIAYIYADFRNKSLFILDEQNEVTRVEEPAVKTNTLLFEASADTPLSVSIGGESIFDDIIHTGEVKTFNSDNNFEFKIGNVDTVSVLFNDNMVDIITGADKNKTITMTIGNSED